jgi:hypothetical protein
VNSLFGRGSEGQAMAVCKKGRRKLVVDDRLFVWWVCESEPDCWVGEVLTVASEDRRFFVRYYLDQQPERRFLVVQGRRGRHVFG